MTQEILNAIKDPVILQTMFWLDTFFLWWLFIMSFDRRVVVKDETPIILELPKKKKGRPSKKA